MFFSLSVFAPENLVSRDEFGRPVPRRPAHSPYYTQGWIWYLVTGFLPISAVRGVVFFIPPYAIGSVPSLSGHAIAYRRRSLPRVHRHRKVVLKVVPVTGVVAFASPCVCVCVFFPSILDIKFVGRTSRGHTGGRSHRIFNPPSFCGACLDFCREKDSAIPFPRRP